MVVVVVVFPFLALCCSCRFACSSILDASLMTTSSTSSRPRSPSREQQQKCRQRRQRQQRRQQYQRQQQQPCLVVQSVTMAINTREEESNTVGTNAVRQISYPTALCGFDLFHNEQKQLTHTPDLIYTNQKPQTCVFPAASGVDYHRRGGGKQATVTIKCFRFPLHREAFLFYVDELH